MDRFLSTDRSSSTSFKKSPKMSSELVEIDKKKKKKEKSFRRFIPAIFSKDNRKDNESTKRKSKDERCFTHYQQPGRFSRCSESSHSNNDGKMQVELNQSLSGSIIEERLNEIKHDLFSAEGNMHSPSNDVLDTSFNSSSVDVRREENQWVLDRDSGRGRSDSQNFNRNLSQQNQCALKRQYSFQETMSFQRNCAPSGRVSAPPSQRFLIRSRSVHPMERPLPAIPQNNAFVNEHPSEYKENEAATTQKAIMVTPKGARYIVHTAQKNNSDLSYTYADKNAQRSSNIQQQLSNNQNDKNFRCSPTSSLKSNDYADSSYTANSSQKSELSPTSSKSGEYYLLGSPHPSNQTSSNDSLADNRHNLVPQNIKVEINEVEEHLYDKTPSTNNLNLIQGNECQDSQNDSASHKVELNDGKNNPEMNQDNPLYDSYANNHVDYKDTERQKKMTNSKNLNQKLEQDSKFDQDKSNQYHENHSSPINKQILFENDQPERVLKKNNLHDNHSSEKSVSQSQPQFIRKKNFHPQESQPNDQVLIASPQGDNYPIYDTPPRSLSALDHRAYSTSDSPKKISSMNNSQNVLTNDLDLSNGSRTTHQNSSPDKNNHQQTEQIYNYSSNDLTPPSRSPPKEGMNYKNINQSCKSNISKQMHSNESQSPKSQGPTHHGRNEKQIKQNYQTSPGQGYQASSESKESLYSNSCTANRQIPLSPQKKRNDSAPPSLLLA